MKKKEIILLLALVAVLVGLVWSVYFWAWGYNKIIDRNKADRWKQTVEIAIKGAEDIAMRPGMSPKVSQIMKFFKETYFRAIPRAYDSDVVAFEIGEKMPATHYNIGVIVLSQDDSRLSEVWKKAFDSNSYAFLYTQPETENLSLLVLKENFPVSRTWRGLLLIHEVGHAFLHAAKVFEDIDNPELKNSYYELETYILQDEILRKIGGKEYSDVLNKEVARIENEIKKNKKNGLKMAPHYDLYREKLAKIFGQPESDRESEMRMDSIWICAFLNFYDKKYRKEEAVARKLIFLANLHESMNFLEKKQSL